MFGIGLTLGWQDVRQSYRRSVLGQLWITLGMGVTIASIGTVFGLIFGAPIVTFLPYVASGIIMWGLISGTLNDGAKAMIEAEHLIKQIPLPKLVYLIRVVVRNLIITAHNIVLFPVILLVVGAEVNWSIVLFPFGVFVVVLAISGLSLVLAICSARFRDVPPIASSVLTVAFYVTPVIWYSDSLRDNELAHLVLGLNPFYHLLQVSRLPLLGQFPTVENWMVALLCAGFAWLAGTVMLKKFSNRIAYWV